MSTAVRLFGGTSTLFVLHLRAEARRLLGWALAMSVVVVATGRSMIAFYPTEAERTQYALTAGASPATAAFNGRGYDLVTAGGITSYEVGFIGLLMFPAVAIHLAVHVTRRQEEAGLTELVMSGRVGRLAPTAAAALALSVTCGVSLMATALGLSAVGLPAAGSWSYATSLTLLAAAFMALGLLTAQLCQSARTANGVALAIALAAYLVRAVIDGREIEAVWVSPMGWLAEVRPWSDGDVRLWPLAAFTVLSVLLTVGALIIAENRDLYAGVIAPRPGAARGGAALSSPLGLAWTLTRDSCTAWTLGLCVWGASLGALSREMTDLVAGNPGIAEAFGISAPEQLVTSLAAVMIGLGAGAMALSAVSRLLGEEDSGRLGLLSSCPVPRWHLWASWIIVVVAQILVAISTASLSLGGVARLATGHELAFMDSVQAGLTYVAPVVLLTCLAVLAGAVSRWGVGLAWALLGWAAMVAILADALRLPEWARDVSVFHVVGLVPVEAADEAALIGFTAAAAVLVTVGISVFQRRSLRAG